MPAGPVAQSFVLMFVILAVSTGAKEKGVTAGIAIGSTVALCGLFAGPVQDGSGRVLTLDGSGWISYMLRRI